MTSSSKDPIAPHIKSNDFDPCPEVLTGQLYPQEKKNLFKPHSPDFCASQNTHRLRMPWKGGGWPLCARPVLSATSLLEIWVL